MQGEHVVELAQLIGIDMRVPHSSSDHDTRPAPVSVIEGFDTWRGEPAHRRSPGPTAGQRAARADLPQVKPWERHGLPPFGR